MEKFKLTNEGVNKLQSEYRHLIDVVREEVTRDLVEARSLGDLSENADYDAARERQGKVESRIKEIEAILNNYELIVENSSSKVVKIGGFVEIEDLELGIKEKYEIVGSIEADPLVNRISNDSPLAKAILGRKKDDICEVNAPQPYKVRIVEVLKN